MFTIVRHAIVAFVLLSFNAIASESLKKCEETMRVDYSDSLSVALNDRVVIKQGIAPLLLNETMSSSHVYSTHTTSSYSYLSKPDFTQPGPYNTDIAVSGTTAHPVNLTLEFKDHANNDVTPIWLNEKLLFIRVWWGRIVSTDMVLDIETGKFLYAQEANYWSLGEPCE